MIRTKKIELTADSFFYILLTIYFKRRWLILIWIWLMIFALLFSANIRSIEYLLILFLLLSQVILVVQYWLYAHSKDNRIYLLPRYFEIDDHQIVEWLDDGTSSTIKLERFVKVMKTGNCYLLFIAKNEYVYLPFSAFENEANKEWFETDVIRKINEKQ
jgi:energy-coupling factor transporter transmembrane protein EcfT